ncbi:MAG: MECDP-synthase [Marinobacter sp.]|nr:MECDP-synthase [Marinobacter sp.]
MFKKTLISLAVASSLGLTGCLSSSDDGGNADPDYKIEDTTIDRSLVRPIFDPNPLSKTFSVPTHFDLLLLLGATQSADHDFTAPSSGPEPVASGLDALSGFSTSSAFNVRFDGALKAGSVEKNKNVFLIALDTDAAVESAPLALPAVNPVDISGQAAPDSQPNYRVDVVNVDGKTNNAIRITPLKPLEEKRKYLVLIGDGILGANDKGIDQSVQGRALGEGALGNPALENVKAIVGGLNELGNSILKPVGQEVALAYTFTTNGDADVLRALAGPIPYLPALGQKVGFTAQLKAVRDNYPNLNFSELTGKLGELREIAKGLENGEIDPSSLTATELNTLTGLGKAQSIQENIEGALKKQIGETLHVAQPRPFVALSNTNASELPFLAALGDNPIVALADTVTITQGAMTVPYYSSTPGDDGTGLTEGYWKGNTALETALNEELSPSNDDIFKFLRDADGELNVNGNFPFPQLQANVTVPITIVRPNPSAPQCSSTPGGKEVTIFQHGITVDRSTALIPGIALAALDCQVVVAMDQPLHGLGEDGGQVPGLTPLDETTVKAKAQAQLQGYAAALADAGFTNPAEQCEAESLPETATYACLQVSNMTKMLNSDYIGERHFGYTLGGVEDSKLVPVKPESLAKVESGSLFLNPTNMLNSRDNLRQNSVDLLNLAASVQFMAIADLQGPDGLNDPIMLGKSVNFVGHSLGGISGTVFASIINDPAVQFIGIDEGTGNPIPSPTAEFLPELKSVVLHNTGGQVTRLLENSKTKSGTLLDGLANAEPPVTQGTSNFENFFYIFQSLVDGGDAVNFAKDLGRWSKTGTNLLVTEVVGDRTVPNEANVSTLSDKAYSSPLAGTEPLFALMDLGANGGVLSDGVGFSLLTNSSAVNDGELAAASFFVSENPCSQANHSTFVGPITGPDSDNIACPGGTNTSAAFVEMISQTINAFAGDPIATPNLDPTNEPIGPSFNTLTSSETLPSALDQNAD